MTGPKYRNDAASRFYAMWKRGEVSNCEMEERPAQDGVDTYYRSIRVHGITHERIFGDWTFMGWEPRP